jgi:hypothetical protein
MPLYVYHDWLIDQGWDQGTEEIEGFCQNACFWGSKTWKNKGDGDSFREIIYDGEGYHISYSSNNTMYFLLWAYDYIDYIMDP